MAFIFKRKTKRKDGTEVVKFGVEWQPHNAQKPKRKQFKSRRLAAEFRDGKEIRDAEQTQIAKSTYRQIGAKWLSAKQKSDIEKGTYKPYERHLRLHLFPICGEDIVSLMDKPRCMEIRDKLMEKLSPAMARAVMATFRQTLDYAEDVKAATANSAARVRIPSQKRHKEKIIIPTKDEIALIRAAIETIDGPPHEGEVLVETLLGTGVRMSEARGARDIDLNFYARVPTITINRRADEWNQISSPKSFSARRTIPLGPNLVRLLKKWLLVRPHSPEGYLFPTSSGTVQNYSNLYNRVWLPILLRAGLIDNSRKPTNGRPLYTLHMLRHAYASALIEVGFRDKKLQERMGHASVQITLDTYGHLWKNLDQDAEEAAAVERVFARNKG